MSNEYVLVRNIATRQVGRLRKSLVDHPIFGVGLEEVPSGTKPFKPLTEIVDEFYGVDEDESVEVAGLGYDEDLGYED